MLAKEIFEKELEICRAQFRKQKGCAWGKCENCAVPLLLQKLHKGEVIEDSVSIEAFKANMLE